MQRRAFVLPTVLFVLLLLGLLIGTFSFHMHSEVMRAEAVTAHLQTRLAAEAGVEYAKLLLATDRLNVARWYDNPDELHRVIVWSAAADPADWVTNQELDDRTVTYRFSLVADDPTDFEQYVRFGISDEASKLNLNEATESQLLLLLQTVLADDPDRDPQVIVDAILDWRDSDDEPRSEEFPAEQEYYDELDVPYRVRNGPFQTVEELLLVRGVTGDVLYGEDFDRNGLLTDNEDDADESFPLDNQDNELSQGLYPYLTVLSYESNVTNANRQRVSLRAGESALREELELWFEDEPGVVDFVISAAAALSSEGGSGGGGSGGEGESGGGGEAGEGESGSGGEQELSEVPTYEEALQLLEQRRQQMQQGGDKQDNLERARQDPSESQGDQSGGGDPVGEYETGDPTGGDESTLGEGEGDTGGEGDGEEGGEGESGGGQDAGLTTPAQLLLWDGGGENPLTVEHLAILLDVTTALPATEQEIPGLIDINTAPYAVLRCVPGMTDELAGSIVETRGSVDATERETTAWLVQEGLVELEGFVSIAPYITARGQQFNIESLGYADHLGMVTRLRVVVDMVGPLAQVVLYRDETELGGRYPIREEDLEEAVRVQ